VKTR